VKLKLPSLNHVQLIGRLVGEPFALTAKDKTPGASFVVASNRFIPQTKKQVSVFVPVICWGDTATAVLASCTKGTPVFVMGSLEERTKVVNKMESKVIQISARSVQFLALRPEDDI
jgi:single-stranded DNA-binding protein